MALSKQALKRAINSVPEGDDVGVWVVGVCRAVESEVRKDDEALIRQLVEALETCDESDGYTGLRQFFDDKAVEAAITARPAGCAGPRCREFD